MELENIIGKTVNLRPIALEDTEYIVKWRKNPAVKRNFLFQKDITVEIHENWMKTKVAAGIVVQYIILQKETSLPIGSVYFRDIDMDQRIAEFGIFIGEDDARGHGYGTEAVHLFVQYGFEKLGLHRIFLRVLAENLAAIQSYKKAGFVQEGLFRDMVKVNNVYHDVVFMARISDQEKE